MTSPARRILRSAPGADPGLLARACAVRIAQARGLDPVADRGARRLAPSLPDLPYDRLGGRLLGEVYQAGLAPRERKRAGVHYTPAAVARFLVGRAWNGGTLLDPACGAGAFLLAALEAGGGEGRELPDLRGLDTDPVAVAIAVEALALETPAGDARRARLFWKRRVRVSDALVTARGPVDALVTNPPFFAATGRAELQRLGRERFAGIYSGRNDVSHFFVALALELLRPRGGLGMVLPAYVLENTFAAGLRRQLAAQLGELEVIDLGTARLFGAQVDAVLVSGRRGEERRARARPGRWWAVPRGGEVGAVLGDLDRLGAGARPRVLRRRPREPVRLLARLERLSPLSRLAHVEKGCETGRNHIFTMDERRARALGLERELIRPLLKGRHVRPFQVEPSGRVLLHLDGSVELDRVPAIRAYLEPFRAELLGRAECRDGRYPWWRLHRPRGPALAAAKAKLVVPYRRAEPAFAVDRTGALNDGGDLRFLLPRAGVDPDYLCAVLNSRVVLCWLSWRGKRKGSLFELFQEPLQRIPVPAPSPELADAIAAAARAQPDPASREQLEEMVARAYGIELGDLRLPEV